MKPSEITKGTPVVWAMPDGTRKQIWVGSIQIVEDCAHIKEAGLLSPTWEIPLSELLLPEIVDISPEDIINDAHLMDERHELDGARHARRVNELLGKERVNGPQGMA